MTTYSDSYQRPCHASIAIPWRTTAPLFAVAAYAHAALTASRHTRSRRLCRPTGWSPHDSPRPPSACTALDCTLARPCDCDSVHATHAPCCLVIPAASPPAGQAHSLTTQSHSARRPTLLNAHAHLAAGRELPLSYTEHTSYICPRVWPARSMLQGKGQSAATHCPSEISRCPSGLRFTANCLVLEIVFTRELIFGVGRRG